MKIAGIADLCYMRPHGTPEQLEPRRLATDKKTPEESDAALFSLTKVVSCSNRWSGERWPRVDSIEVELLPTYAPKLNPAEQVWNHTKYRALANYLPEDMNELGWEITRSILDTQSTSSLLRSFFKRAGLDL